MAGECWPGAWGMTADALGHPGWVSLALFPVAPAPTALVALAVACGFTSGAPIPVAFSMLPELVGTGRIYCGLGLVQMVESLGASLRAPQSG